MWTQTFFFITKNLRRHEATAKVGLLGTFFCLQSVYCCDDTRAKKNESQEQTIDQAANL